MSEKRQKRRSNPASKVQVESDSIVPCEGSKRNWRWVTAKNLEETDHLMEEMLEKENLIQAVERVMQNKGAAE